MRESCPPETAAPGNAGIKLLLKEADTLVHRDTTKARSVAGKALDLTTAALWRHNLDITTIDKTRLAAALPEARELVACCADILLVLAKSDLIQDKWRSSQEFSAESARLFELLQRDDVVVRALLTQAIASRNLRELDAAAALFQRSLQLSRALDDQTGIVKALVGRAYILDKQHRSEEAKQLYDEAEQIACASKTGELQIHIVNYRIDRESKQGRLDTALKTAEMAITHYRSSGDYWGLGNALNQAGLVLANMGRNGEAVEHHNEAVLLARRLASRSSEANRLHCKGLALINIGRYDEALELFTSAAAMHADLNERDDEARSYNNIANALHSLGQYGRSLHFARLSMAMHETLKIGPGTAIAHTHIANALGRLGRHDQALEHHSRALKIHRHYREELKEAFTLSHIANLYRDLNDIEKAADYAARILSIARSIGSRNLESWSRVCLGACCESRKDLEGAEEHFQAGLLIARSCDDLRCESSCLQAQARLRYLRGQYPEALALFDQALALFDTMNDQAQKTRALIEKARVHRSLGAATRALAILQQALLDAGRADFEQIIPDIHKEQSAIYEERGEIEPALRHYKLFHETQQKQMDREARERLHNLRVAEELEQVRRDADLEQSRRTTLERELDARQRELMSLTLLSAKNGDALRNVYRQIKALGREAPASLQAQVTRLSDTLRDTLESSRDWGAFEQRFTRVHSNFLPALHQRFPDLSPVETKVCSLVKLNLSVKEMSGLLGVGQDTIKKHRYNIRRKLKLRQGENLTRFLAGF